MTPIRRISDADMRGKRRLVRADLNVPMEELDAPGAALEAPERPSVAIVGGSKVSTGIAVLKNLVAKVDHVIIGGGMADTFLYADGAPMGRSLPEADQVATPQAIGALAETAAGLTRDGPAVSVAGGGDTVAALNAAGVADDFTCVSSAGGAFLEWLEGTTLPGIAALRTAAAAA